MRRRLWSGVVVLGVATLSGCAVGSNLERCYKRQGEGHCLDAAGESHAECRLHEVHEALRLGCAQAPGGRACALYADGTNHDWNVCPKVLRHLKETQLISDSTVKPKDALLVRIALHNASLPPRGLSIVRIDYRPSGPTRPSYRFTRDEIEVEMSNPTATHTAFTVFDRRDGEWRALLTQHRCPFVEFDPTNTSLEDCWYFVRTILPRLKVPPTYETCRVQRQRDPFAQADWIVTFCGDWREELEQAIQIEPTLLVLSERRRPGARW